MLFRVLFLLFITASCFSQEKSEANTFVDVNYFYGSILRHNKDISHLIKNHPDGLIIGYNHKTFGNKRWERAYNMPSWGVSFINQNSHNDILGGNYGLYGHVNFYFLKRNMFFRIGQGIAYNTNPFNLDTNPKNNAYGSHLLSSTYIMLNFTKSNIFKNFGIQTGISLLHYSNANVKSPNSSTNAFLFNIGATYQFETSEITSKDNSENAAETSEGKYSEPIHYNLVVRGGVNASDYIGLGQQGFFVFSAFADKRINYKSSLQLGADVFLSKFLENEIAYEAAAFPDSGTTGDEDYKRVGIFVGHELHMNNLALVSQIGYYVYYPYDFEGRTYIRAGLKYYFSSKLFAATTLKSHGAKAEAIEFGLGIRL